MKFIKKIFRKKDENPIEKNEVYFHEDLYCQVEIIPRENSVNLEIENEKMWFKKEKINLDGLVKVEQELGVKLPGFLWDFYRNDSRLIRKLRKVSNDADYIHLTTDFEWMITHNRDLLQLPKHCVYVNALLRSATAYTRSIEQSKGIGTQDYGAVIENSAEKL